MPDTPTLQDFTARVGAHFRLEGAEAPVLSLLKAGPLARVTGAPGGREPFDLIFVGPERPVLPQKTYRMESDGFEPLEIFIVPIGPVEGGMGYQAIFS